MFKRINAERSWLSNNNFTSNKIEIVPVLLSDELAQWPSVCLFVISRNSLRERFPDRTARCVR